MVDLDRKYRPRRNTAGSTVSRLWEITSERPERAEKEGQIDSEKSRKTRRARRRVKRLVSDGGERKKNAFCLLLGL